MIQAVGAENSAVAGNDVRGVFDGHVGENLMSRVGAHLGDGADQPFSGVEHVGQGILDGTSPRAAIGVIDLPICRTIGGEVLARDRDKLNGCTESA